MNNPYFSIGHAVAAAAANDTVYVAGGIYYEMVGIYINKPITLLATGAAVIDESGRNTAISGKYAVEIVNTNDVMMDGFTVENLTGNGSKGIWIINDQNNFTTTNHIVVTNCIVTNVGWVSNDLGQIPTSDTLAAIAIKLEGGNSLSLSNVSITNDTVYNCATGYAEAIEVTGNVDTFNIDNCLVHDISNIGIDIAGNYSSTTAPASVNRARNGIINGNTVYNCISAIAESAGIYLDGSQNIRVSRNRIHDNEVGISLGGEELTTYSFGSFIIADNLVYGNLVTGIYVGNDTTNSSNPLQNVNIYNNTFYKNSSDSNEFRGEIELQNIDGANVNNNVIYSSPNKRAIVALYDFTISNYAANNNDFYNDDSSAVLLDIGSGVYSFNGHTDYGGSYTLQQFKNLTGLEVNSLIGNPAFNNPGADDFSIGAASHAINIGGAYDTAISGLTDFQGNNRLSGASIDAGAYEFQIVPPTVEAITGQDTVCQGSTIQLSDATGGGAWISSNNSVATIDNNGLLTGQMAGNDTIYYSVAANGETTTVAKSIIVDPQPSAGIISGPETVCVGDTINLNESVVDGVWTSDSFVSVDNSGRVDGIVSGNTTIAYAVTNECGTATTTYVVSVNPQPVVGPIIGSSTVCPGSTILLTDSSINGIWSTENNAILTVDDSGLVTGELSGDAVVTYTTSNTCGAASATFEVIVLDDSLCNSPNSVSTVPKQANINIYPNPAREVVHIKATTDVNVTVLDMSGRMIIQQDNATNLNIKSLIQGIYIFEIYNKNGARMATFKMIKIDR